MGKYKVFLYNEYDEKIECELTVAEKLNKVDAQKYANFLMYDYEREVH